MHGSHRVMHRNDWAAWSSCTKVTINVIITQKQLVLHQTRVRPQRTKLRVEGLALRAELLGADCSKRQTWSSCGLVTEWFSLVRAGCSELQTRSSSEVTPLSAASPGVTWWVEGRVCRTSPAPGH